MVLSTSLVFLMAHVALSLASNLAISFVGQMTALATVASRKEERPLGAMGVQTQICAVRRKPKRQRIRSPVP